MVCRTVIPLALALLGLVACGGENGTDAPAAAGAAPGGPRECPWVTSAEASEAIGAAVTVTRPPADPVNCYIQSEPRTFSGEVDVLEGHTLDAILAGRGTPEPIEGLGDQASWVSTSSWEGADLAGMVGVELGGRGITVILVTATAQPDLRAKAEALARAVVARL